MEVTSFMNGPQLHDISNKFRWLKNLRVNGRQCLSLWLEKTIAVLLGGLDPAAKQHPAAWWELVQASKEATAFEAPNSTELATSYITERNVSLQGSREHLKGRKPRRVLLVLRFPQGWKKDQENLQHQGPTGELGEGLATARGIT